MAPRASPGKKQRYEILFEGIDSKMDVVLDGFKVLTERMDRLEQRMEGIEFRVGRIEQDTNGFHAAIIENSNELRRFQHALQQLQHEVSKLTERFEEHLKAHAT